MSAVIEAGLAQKSNHGGGHGALHEERHPHASRGTFWSYMTGFALSVCVMYHMDQNMMPMSPHEALRNP